MLPLVLESNVGTTNGYDLCVVTTGDYKNRLRYYLKKENHQMLRNDHKMSLLHWMALIVSE